jgi:hypothetical protein
MTEVATNGDRTIDYIAGKLSTYARSSQFARKALQFGVIHRTSWSSHHRANSALGWAVKVNRGVLPVRPIAHRRICRSRCRR